MNQGFVRFGTVRFFGLRKTNENAPQAEPGGVVILIENQLSL